MAKGWRRNVPYNGHLDDQLVWDAMAKHGLTREEACLHVIAERGRHAVQGVADREAVAAAERTRLAEHQRVDAVEHAAATERDRLTAERLETAKEDAAHRRDEIQRRGLDIFETPVPAAEPELVRDDEKPKHQHHKGRK